MVKLYTDKHNTFAAADKAWGIELERIFGKDAGTARYQPRGRGEEGSELRRLYEAKDAARVAWETE